MKREASKMVEKYEEEQFDGEIRLKLKKGGLSAFEIPMTKKNAFIIKKILDKQRNDVHK